MHFHRIYMTKCKYREGRMKSGWQTDEEIDNFWMCHNIAAATFVLITKYKRQSSHMRTTHAPWSELNILPRMHMTFYVAPWEIFNRNWLTYIYLFFESGIFLAKTCLFVTNSIIGDIICIFEKLKSTSPRIVQSFTQK